MTLFNKAHELKYKKVLKSAFLNKTTDKDLYNKIVNTPFKDPLLATYLSLGIVVLLIVSDDNKSIKRVALSDTIHAEGATRTSEKNFNEIEIPVGHKDNIIAQSIDNSEIIETGDWKDLFVPALSPASARLNQASAGIEYSLVAPLKNHPYGGALIFSFFKHNENFLSAVKIAEYYAKLVSKKLG